MGPPLLPASRLDLSRLSLLSRLEHKPNKHEHETESLIRSIELYIRSDYNSSALDRRFEYDMRDVCAVAGFSSFILIFQCRKHSRDAHATSIISPPFSPF